ncbi:MAG: DnaJ domain-containing protein, partial [Candidatus Neomarinimicrobiota bacterium]
MENWYSILGISEKASHEEIKKAYRSLSMKYHPDRPG